MNQKDFDISSTTLNNQNNLNSKSQINLKDIYDEEVTEQKFENSKFQQQNINNSSSQEFEISKNNLIQKKQKQLKKYSDGNIISLEQIDQEINLNGHDNRKKLFSLEQMDSDLKNKNYQEESLVQSPIMKDIEFDQQDNIFEYNPNIHVRESNISCKFSPQQIVRSSKSKEKIMQNIGLQQNSTYVSKQKITSNFNVNQEILNTGDNQSAPLSQQEVKKTTSSILVFTKILRFSKIIKEQSRIFLERNLKQKYVKMINDKSYSPETSIFSKFQSQLFFCNLLMQFPVFNPTSKSILIWNMFKFIKYLILLFCIPFQILFEDKILGQKEFDFTELYRLIAFAEMFDVLVTINTGFDKGGATILNRKQILINYVLKLMYEDVLAILGLWFYFESQSDYFLYFYMVRLITLSGIFDYFDIMFQLELRYPTFYELSYLCFTIIFVAHYSGCVFYYTAMYEIKYGEQNTWIQQLGMEDANWFKIYIEALYFSFITMSTVGYGDISPNTQTEKIVCIFITIVSCGVFAFAMNTIGQIFRDKQIRNASLNIKKFEVIKYMRKRNISKKLQLQVVKEVEHIEKQEQNGNTKGLEILKIINQKVQDNIFLEYYGNVIKNSKFAKIGSYSQEFLSELATSMYEDSYRPGSTVFQQGDYDNRYLIILDGSLKIYFENKNHIVGDKSYVSSLSGRQEISHRQFYTSFDCQYTVMCSTVCRIVYFKRQDMLQILQKFPKDYEQFCLVKDSILFNKNQLVEQCYTCQSWVHMTLDCPYVHQNISKYQHIGRENIVTKNDRQATERKGKVCVIDDRFNALKNQEEVREELMRIRTDTISFFYQEPVTYDLYQEDKDFFIQMPKLVLNVDREIEIKEYLSADEELIFEELQDAEEQDSQSESSKSEDQNQDQVESEVDNLSDIFKDGQNNQNKQGSQTQIQINQVDIKSKESNLKDSGSQPNKDQDKSPKSLKFKLDQFSKKNKKKEIEEDKHSDKTVKSQHQKKPQIIDHIKQQQQDYQKYGTNKLSDHHKKKNKEDSINDALIQQVVDLLKGKQRQNTNLSLKNKNNKSNSIIGVLINKDNNQQLQQQQLQIQQQQQQNYRNQSIKFSMPQRESSYFMNNQFRQQKANGTYLQNQQNKNGTVLPDYLAQPVGTNLGQQDYKFRQSKFIIHEPFNIIELDKMKSFQQYLYKFNYEIILEILKKKYIKNIDRLNKLCGTVKFKREKTMANLTGLGISSRQKKSQKSDKIPDLSHHLSITYSQRSKSMLKNVLRQSQRQRNPSQSRNDTYNDESNYEKNQSQMSESKYKNDTLI